LRLLRRGEGSDGFLDPEITYQVQPAHDQQALLDELKAATVKAIWILKTGCPTELPSTATGRLAVMRPRVDAMLHSVRTVGPALDRFYHDDE